MADLFLQTGGKGILMKIEGSPVPANNFRCKVVSGTLAEIDVKNPDWRGEDTMIRFGIAEVS